MTDAVQVGQRWRSRDGKRTVTVLHCAAYDCEVESATRSRWFIRTDSLRRLYVLDASR